MLQTPIAPTNKKETKMKNKITLANMKEKESVVMYA